MIWRPCDPTDRDALLALTREPMGGSVQLVWGLEKLMSPAECSHLQVYAIETEGEVNGCAMAWDWPGGHRYLSGLRFGRNMKSRPSPKFWKQAFECLLHGTDQGWTCIGSANQRARRVLEKSVSWLPNYTPRQKITTWFIPLPSDQANAARCADHQLSGQLTPLDWRHIEIAGGSGITYQLGRFLNKIGLPGIPQPRQAIRVADYQPSPSSTPRQIRDELKQISGFDGLVVILPEGAELQKQWSLAAPRLSWTWHSTLYSLNWTSSAKLSPVPPWKGFWL